MPVKYYAVKEGRVPGIYLSWDDCKKQVMGYSGAVYKSFSSETEAKAFINPELSTEPTADATRAIAYVDGSYLHAERRFSYGAILLWQGEQMQFCQAFSDAELAAMRNVAGEIKGAEFIMRYCVEKKIPAVDIYYDYEGIEKWCTGVWQANKSGTQNYAKAYQELKKQLDIRFVKVKGHSGVKYNELADKLAKSALGIE
ncbi:MAG: RNase H [Ruminococcaceae bacterium]|nr:RNase H [Oscillospiraceae bacterium]